MNQLYQPLTAEGAALKEYWRPCVDWSRRLQDLRDEIKDVEGRAEEVPLREEQRKVGAELETLRAEVRERIAATPTLTSNERRILRLRYLCADPWEAIALQVGRETSAVYTAYRKALNKAALATPLPQVS
ncbi:MAG: sigma-70 family RNA polymerase sigma factor [Clostridia bacterium]|nr:sigma-70 family RNA polymerase sigma factor [Clostridia bacterium]